MVVGLPLAVWRHERAVDAGLSTQSIGPWLVDVAKSAGIGAVFAALGGALVLWLIRRFPKRWWLPSAGAVVAFAVLTLYLSPVIIDPLFNKFEPLPKGALRSDVLRLADRAGVDVGEVYRVDASRRTTSVNAYVGGIGHTKRVVLYDNLVEDFPPDQVRSVVAHELGHVVNDDIPKGLLWIVIVAPAGTFLIQRLAERFAGGRLDAGGQARRPRDPRGRAGPRAGELRPQLRGQRPLTPGRGARGRVRARDHAGLRGVHRAREEPRRCGTWATRTRRDGRRRSSGPTRPRRSGWASAWSSGASPLRPCRRRTRAGS